MSDSLPLPPPELIARVTGSADPEQFLDSGRASVHDIRTSLRVLDVELDDAARLLDFGCGCGRVLRHLQDLAASVELHGVDTDRDAIAWADAHLPFASFHVVHTHPPTAFPDEHFDLVINHSVLSHLPEDHQDEWLAELARVTRRGGHVQLTVHGTKRFEEVMYMMEVQGTDTSAYRSSFERTGFAHVPGAGWEGTFPEHYQNAFHSPQYLFDHWSKFFDVRAVITRRALGYQDVVLLQRT